jgi:flagellar motor protein MotB
MEALDFQGVDLEEVASVVVVRFTEGLFLDDTALHPWAVAVLTELGSRLLPYEDDISITVIGYVDDGERDSEAERDSLRIRRAAEVVRFLVEAAELPAGLFSIGYPGSSTPLVPNETWPDRSRNRTACLIISARTGFRGTP